MSDKNMEQSKRNLDVTTSSMDVMALNNLVVSMRSLVKQSRVQIINKLTHQIRRYRKKKGSEEQVAKFQKKADRLKSEIDALKHINLDQAAKNALACSVSFEEAAKEGNMERRATARLASHKLLQPKVEKFRKEHDDWKALAAFLLSKNTGRRFKKKTTKKTTKKTPTNDASTGIVKKQTGHTDTGSESSDGSEPEELEADESDELDNSDSVDDGSVSPEAQLSRHQCSGPSKTHGDPCPDIDDCQDDIMTIPCVTTTVLPSKSECRKAKPKSVTPLRKTTKAKQEVMLSNRTAAAASTNANELKDTKSAKKEKLKRNANTKTVRNVMMTQETIEMVVQTLNLGELISESDIVVRPDFIVTKREEDRSFLYTPARGNESCAKKPKKKVKDPFFVGESGSEENETSSEDGDSGSEGIAGETETQSLGRKISKNMVQSSFVDTLSRASSSRIREKQVSSRRMHEEKLGKPNVGGKTFHHPIQNVGDRKRPPGKNAPWQSEDSTKGRTLRPGGATVTGQPEKEPETKLHPSWEASKKRKQQVAGVKAFCGKKIKFDD